MEAVTTLATIPAVVALVNLVKQFGITGRWASLTAVTLGVVLACAQTYLPSGILATITTGLTLGLGAAGLYDLTPATAASEKPAGSRGKQAYPESETH
ncbi:MAG: hypothetical protein PUK40_06360 [Actinomycetaceae bacterium]|nr:hypothetical protein [Actinomycetaceae bacterium]